MAHVFALSKSFFGFGLRTIKKWEIRFSDFPFLLYLEVLETFIERLLDGNFGTLFDCVIDGLE